MCTELERPLFHDKGGRGGRQGQQRARKRAREREKEMQRGAREKGKTCVIVVVMETVGAGRASALPATAQGELGHARWFGGGDKILWA